MQVLEAMAMPNVRVRCVFCLIELNNQIRIRALRAEIALPRKSRQIIRNMQILGKLSVITIWGVHFSIFRPDRLKLFCFIRRDYLVALQSRSSFANFFKVLVRVILLHLYNMLFESLYCSIWLNPNSIFKSYI